MSKNDKGYSLIELAIALVIIGLVLVPAIAMYQVQVVKERLEDTERTVNAGTASIGGFRSVYGRYPCPARLDLAPGDVGYGLEDRDDVAGVCNFGAAGACTDGICTADSNNATPDEVLIGSLPFKTLNLQEFEAYDPYGHRVMYGVTEDLTKVNTFDMGRGAITILDKNNNHLTTPDHTGHFVVISYGESDQGAYGKSGAQTSACGALGAENDNCNMDATFKFGEYDSDFRHYMDFFSSVATSEWQISEDNSGDIHVKNASNIAIGATMSAADNLLGSESARVRSNAADEGRVLASEDVISNSLCRNVDAPSPAGPGGDCFSPALIAGQLAEGEGMSCGTQLMVGIQDGAPVCADDISITCPPGNFMVGIVADGTDADGNPVAQLICDSEPVPCEDTQVTSWCGENLTVPGTYDTGYSVTYSGECYRINDYNSAYWTGLVPGMTYGEIQTRIGEINNEARTQVACNTSNSTAQIRETYRCEAGTFQHIVAHEKRYPWQNITTNLTTTSSTWVAEPNEFPYQAFGTGPATPSGNGHDCWCREDYRANTMACGTNFTGNQTVIYKHRCPQNMNNYEEIFRDRQNCACTPSQNVQYQSCTDYYESINGPISGGGQLSGNVMLTYDTTCVNNVPVASATPSAVDTSACSCNPQGPYVDYDNCPNGTTNNFSWSWPGLGTQAVSGVEGIEIEEWTCPGTSTNGMPDPNQRVISNYTPIPACTCDSDLTDEEIIACPPGKQGEGLVYEREWDCSLNGGIGDWEPQSEWELIEDRCNSCSWQKPSGTPQFSEYALGQLVGSTCSCGAEPAPICRDYTAGGYDLWTNCQCVVQDD